jgi:hypothetical protein
MVILKTDPVTKHASCRNTGESATPTSSGMEESTALSWTTEEEGVATNGHQEMQEALETMPDIKGLRPAAGFE